MAKQLICSLLVLLLATLSGAQYDPVPDPNCPCPLPSCWRCPRPCTAPGCPRCYRFRVPYPVCPPDYNPNPTPDLPPAPVDNYDGYSLFVFGDSFADNGNLPNASNSDIDRPLIRCWYIPYGSSDGNDDGSSSSQPQATGRFSNYMVQSDFVAKMLGLDMAPRPYNQQKDESSCDDTGMTFATGGSGVYSVPQDHVPTLSDQVDLFENLVNSQKISPERLAKSVALVAVSGNDYDRVGVAFPKSFGDVSAFTLNVTTGIASSIDRLRALGVPKVLVNNLQPVGCAPSQTKANDHTGCDGAGNAGADVHNRNLAHLLEGKDGVLVVDLHAAFMAILDGNTKRFKHLYTPYCEATDEGDFCGDTADDGTRNLYTLGEGSPKQYFYWDDMHPTQAGWTAVMEQVEDSIKQFVGVAQG